MSTQDRIINNLLGPNKPELDCDECFAIIDQAVDSVLAGDNIESAYPLLHSHLQGCPVCNDEFDTLLELVKASN